MQDLDERIAREVMNFDDVHYDACGTLCHNPRDCNCVRHGVPFFSGQMDDTWRVVDYLARRGYWLLLSTPVNPGSPCQAEFAPHGEVRCGSSEYTGHGDTAAEAICRAALRVVEGTTSEGCP